MKSLKHIDWESGEQSVKGGILEGDARPPIPPDANVLNPGIGDVEGEVRMRDNGVITILDCFCCGEFNLPSSFSFWRLVSLDSSSVLVCGVILKGGKFFKILGLLDKLDCEPADILKGVNWNCSIDPGADE